MNVHSIRRTTIQFLLAFAAPWSVTGYAADSTAVEAGRLAGTPELATLCEPGARAELEFAIAAYNAFAWTDLDIAIDRSLRADSGCAMAHWLRALALLGEPTRWRQGWSAATLALGRVVLDHAREAGLRTEREQAYVDALAVLFVDDETIDAAARTSEFKRALARLSARYGADMQTAALHATLADADDCARL
jgi:hypothetical protein